MAAKRPRRFIVRLEDPDSDEYRVTSLLAPDAEAAQEACERSERRLVEFHLPEKRLKDEEAASKERGRPTGSLVAHQQTKPYEVVSVTEATKRKKG